MHNGETTTITVFWVTDHREYLQRQYGEPMIQIKVALEGMKNILNHQVLKILYYMSFH